LNCCQILDKLFSHFQEIEDDPDIDQVDSGYDGWHNWKLLTTLDCFRALNWSFIESIDRQVLLRLKNSWSQNKSVMSM